MQPPQPLYRAQEKTGHRPDRPTPEQDSQASWSETCTPVQTRWGNVANVIRHHKKNFKFIFISYWLCYCIMDLMTAPYPHIPTWNYKNPASHTHTHLEAYTDPKYLHGPLVIPQVKGAVANPQICMLFFLSNTSLKLEMTQQKISSWAGAFTDTPWLTTIWRRAAVIFSATAKLAWQVQLSQRSCTPRIFTFRMVYVVFSYYSIFRNESFNHTHVIALNRTNTGYLSLILNSLKKKNNNNFY